VCKKFFCLLAIVSLVFGGCSFPSKKTELINVENLGEEQVITAPAKVYLNDGTIVLFQKGFSVENSRIIGIGKGFYINNLIDQLTKEFSIPLSDVAALTYHATQIKAGSAVGSVIMGITAVPLTILAAYCLVNPKACFGSCPTVYVRENDQYQFCSELFSYSVSPFMEADDLDLLIGNLDKTKDPLDIRITNEALETHFINEMKLVQVIHPKNTAVYPTSSNQMILFNEFHTPVEAKNSQGVDVLSRIEKNDQVGYRSPEELVLELKKGAYFDFLDLKMKIPPSTPRINLLLKVRNTLMSTILFYEVVLASQGIDALSWIEKMNTDPVYANLFKSIYHTFSGITIKIKKDNEWIAAALPTYDQEELQVRLEFIPDNFFFDRISFDYGNEQEGKNLLVEVLDCERICDYQGQERNDLMKLLNEKDEHYLVTEPSDVYHFYYHLGDISEEETLSLFVSASGYYTEWLRGKWLTEKSTPNYKFNLYDFGGTFNQLAESWLSNKKMMEEAFFKTRIPIRKEK